MVFLKQYPTRACQERQRNDECATCGDTWKSTEMRRSTHGQLPKKQIVGRVVNRMKAKKIVKERDVRKDEGKERFRGRKRRGAKKRADRDVPDVVPGFVGGEPGLRGY